MIMRDNTYDKLYQLKLNHTDSHIDCHAEKFRYTIQCHIIISNFIKE